jgi:16S rRNA A1518/A1519 N6-dimethyltransferase RsmA/KsgA/DIM1 with predicted DNA glycosylase/AP lyase activity
MLTEVPYQPSNNLYKKAIKYLNIENQEKVIDIGCGDGRVLRYAAEHYPNAEFIGIDRNFLLILYAKFINFFQRRQNLHFIKSDIHHFDISSFDKIYLYLLPKVTENILFEKQKELKKGCTILSFHYNFGKEFSSIHNISQYPVKYRNKKENIYKWINQ